MTLTLLLSYQSRTQLRSVQLINKANCDKTFIGKTGKHLSIRLVFVVHNDNK